MVRRTQRGIWDVDAQQLDLRKPAVLRWYVTRKIHAGDWAAIDQATLRRLLPSLRLDRHLKAVLSNYVAPHAPARRAHTHAKRRSPRRRA